MANNLTGDFDAIFQVSVKQINGILATMHQSRIDPLASPTFPHSIIIPVGELPEILQPWNKYFVDWVGGVAQRGGLPRRYSRRFTPNLFRKYPRYTRKPSRAWRMRGL